MVCVTMTKTMNAFIVFVIVIVHRKKKGKVLGRGPKIELGGLFATFDHRPEGNSRPPVTPRPLGTVTFP